MSRSGVRRSDPTGKHTTADHCLSHVSHLSCDVVPLGAKHFDRSRGEVLVQFELLANFYRIGRQKSKTHPPRYPQLKQRCCGRDDPTALHRQCPSPARQRPFRRRSPANPSLVSRPLSCQTRTNARSSQAAHKRGADTHYAPRRDRARLVRHSLWRRRTGRVPACSPLNPSHRMPGGLRPREAPLPASQRLKIQARARLPARVAQRSRRPQRKGRLSYSAHRN
jgi:hypothetical protein